MKALGLALSLFAAASAQAQAGRAYVGVATDPRDGTPIYEEHHYLREGGERWCCIAATTAPRSHAST